MHVFLYLFLVLSSPLEKELFDNGSIENALLMDITEPIDYAIKYFLLKQFRQNVEEANFTALSAPEENEIVLLLAARANSQNGKLFLPQHIRVKLLQEIGRKVADAFFENKYQFREMISLQSMDNRLDALDVLKNVRCLDNLVIAKFFFYIETRVYLLKNVIEELKFLADKKNKNAYCFLGQAYLTGTGVEKDIDKAFEYFWAGQDDNRSASFLGIGKILMLEDYKHNEGAINAFKLAKGELQDAEAEYCLHVLTEDTAVSNIENAACLKRAAIAGYLPAVQRYTDHYLEQGQIDSAVFSLMSITQYSPIFIQYDEMAFTAYLEKNYRKACLIYLFLSEFNLPVSITNSVYLMEKHRFFDIQDTLLYEMYKLLSLTNPVVNKKLGDCYFYGKGVEKSLESAFHSYLASKPFCTDGAYCTAYMYEKGLGVPQNLYEAKRIIQKSLNRESLYLVKFYALLRINLKIILQYYRIPLLTASTAFTISGWGLHNYLFKKIK